MSTSQFQDVSTVVSILPYLVNIDLPTVFPGRYTLEGNSEGKFTFVHIRRGRTDRYLGGPTNNGVVSLPILSEEIADAIVKDHIRANICVVPGIAEPGIFALPGASNDQVIAQCQQLSIARAKQKQWYIKLVEQADSDWKRTGNTRAVGRLAREAAQRLGLQKEWNTEENVHQQEINKCPICTSLINPTAIICMTCKYILNKPEYDKIKANFAISEK